jgi:hypothetical protein
MFYILDNDKIVLYNENAEILVDTLEFMPQYKGKEILGTDKNIVEFDNQFYFEDDEEYITKKTQAEKERITKLYLTRADVERGIYQAKGMDFDDILAYVTQLQPQGLDIKALKIELKANNFYRGNPYVSAIGALLGFTEEQLNLFFETNDYTVLLPREEPIEIPIEEPIAYDDI